MLKSIIKTGCVAACLMLGAGQAQAFKIQSFNLHDKTEKQDIHVEFDRSAKNWTTATSKKVAIKLLWSVHVKSNKAIDSNFSKIRFTVLDGGDTEQTVPLKEHRSSASVWTRNIHWSDHKTLEVAGNKLNWASHAVAACQKIYANGGRPDKAHRVFVGNVRTKVLVDVRNMRHLFYNVRSETKTVVTPVFAYCEKDPEWKPPTRAGNPLEILSFAVHPKSDAEKCPKPYELKVTFQARWAKTVKFRIRHKGKLSKLYTRELEKDGDKHRLRFTKTYKLDPGPSTFQIEVRDGPKTEVITKQVDCPPFKVISTFLKYRHGNETYCAKKVRERVIFKTTRPGWVRYQIKHQGGLVVAEGKATAKRVGDEYIAVARRTLTFKEDFEADMMAEVTTQPDANSGWTELAVECLKLSDPTIVMSDPENKGGQDQCPRQGKVNVRAEFNQGGKKVSLKVNCSNGFSETFEATTRKNRIKGGYRIFRSFKFPVTKTEKVSCAVIDMDNGKALTFTGHEYACVHRAVELPQDDLTVEPKPTASTQHDVKVAPQPSVSTPVDDTPNCTTKWKKTCSVEPVKTCTRVLDRECKVVPTRTCATKYTKSCKRVRVRDCQQVRGRTVCKAKWKKECTPQAKQVCSVKKSRQCTPVAKTKCQVAMKKTCQRSKVVQCQR